MLVNVVIIDFGTYTSKKRFGFKVENAPVVKLKPCAYPTLVVKTSLH